MLTCEFPHNYTFKSDTRVNAIVEKVTADARQISELSRILSQGTDAQKNGQAL